MVSVIHVVCDAENSQVKDLDCDGVRIVDDKVTSTVAVADGLEKEAERSIEKDGLSVVVRDMDCDTESVNDGD